MPSYVPASINLTNRRPYKAKDLSVKAKDNNVNYLQSYRPHR